MKQKILMLYIIIISLILSCETTEKRGEEEKPDRNKIPGIATMERFGRLLGPEEVLYKIGESMQGIPGGNIAQAAYLSSLNEPNNEPVFVIESIEYNSEGLATNIKGHVETPFTFREYVVKGGLGVPVYEAAAQNEFGVIFGRPGNIAVRDGVVVKVNPLNEAYIYDLKIGSETYDKIYTAGILYQAYEAVRTPFLKNKIVEFQGILLNSASKKAIMEEIKKFKEENKNMTEVEVMINFLASNKTYLEEIEKSNRESRERIKKGREMLDAISSGCGLQTTGIVLLFTQMATDIVSLFFDPFNAPNRIMEYTYRNIPKNSSLSYSNLEDVRRYGNYQLRKYQNNLNKNQDLWKKFIQITGSL